MTTLPVPRVARALSSPELALLRAIDLGVVVITAVGALATLAAAAISGGDIAGAIAAASVLATAFVWTTRVAMQRASAGPAEEMFVWVMVSYAAKGVLILVGVKLVAHDEHLSRAAFGLTLLAGILATAALQYILWRPRRTESVQPVVTVLPEAYDDDAAVAAARAANVPRSVKVPPR